MTEWPISVLEAPIDTVPLPRAASPGPMHPRRMSESVQPGPSVAVQQTPSRTIPATGAPMSNSVLAQPAVSPQNEAYTAALAAHHARLVGYYWHYAQQGLVAPVVEGDDMQFRARNEAVEWARSHGVIVNDVGGHFIEPVTAQIPNNQPSVPTRQTSAPIMFQGALDLGPGPRPALPQPIHASTLPSSSRAASMPVPAMTSIAPTYAPPANVRPLPAVPPQRRPLPTPAVSAVPSDVLTGNVKYPSPSNTAKHNPSTTGPMKPLDRVASVAFSSDGTGKRPLPMPPPLRSDTDPSPTYASVQSSYPDDILARGLQSVAITVDEAPAAIPQIAPHPVQVTVLEAELSSSTTPIIAFSNSDEANPAEPAPAIALPSFSFGDDDAPVVQHSAQAAPSSSTARVHPRHDPSHPSHYLYHPTSTPSRLEAGAIACAGCRQQMFGRALIAMGREWHPDCFRCCEKACGQLLEMVQFDGCEEDVEDGDEDVDNVDETREPRKELRVYCMVHYEERYAEVCWHCKTSIADTELVRLSDPRLKPPLPSQTWHALHFWCAGCGDPFVDPSSLAKGKEGTLAKPYIVHKGYAYCEGCDLRMYKPRCSSARCGRAPIPSDWVEAGGQKYHEDCFRCVTCETPLTGSYLMRDDGPEHGGEKTYCVACYDIRAKEEAVAARQDGQE